MFVLAASLYLSRSALTVSRYEVAVPGITETLRIVQLSDLHNSEFGKGNTRLIRKVREQNPDLILMTGDMLNQTEQQTDIAADLVKALSAVAPVYYSYGNHEVYFEKHFGTDLRPLFTEAGAEVLEYNWVDVEIRGQALRIGGVYGYCLPIWAGSEAWEEESIFLEAFQDTARTKIFLSHMPICWIQSSSLDCWDVDLVFAGHAHGGQIRFPWIGGLYAPDQGWFPGKCAGLYESKDSLSCLVLSRGLGTSGKLPRLNNIPEIVVVDVIPAS